MTLGSDAKRKASAWVGLLEATCGQRKQASWPSCRHHLQFARIVQGGSFSCTLATNRTVFSTNRHFPESLAKCWHAFPAQGPAKRKISVGATGPDSASSSSVIGRGFAKACQRGSATVPLTMPKATLSGQPGNTLGHRGQSRFSMINRSFWCRYRRFPVVEVAAGSARPR